jgi:hypothetical protein
MALDTPTLRIVFTQKTIQDLKDQGIADYEWVQNAIDRLSDPSALGKKVVLGDMAYFPADSFDATILQNYTFLLAATYTIGEVFYVQTSTGEVIALHEEEFYYPDRPRNYDY